MRGRYRSKKFLRSEWPYAVAIGRKEFYGVNGRVAVVIGRKEFCSATDVRSNFRVNKRVGGSSSEKVFTE